MIFGAMALAACIYAAYAWACFNPDIKGQNWLIWFGLSCVISANAIWLGIARTTIDPKRLLLYAIYWDVIVTGTSIIVPILVFNVRLHTQDWIGVAFIICGIFIMKFHP